MLITNMYRVYSIQFIDVVYFHSITITTTDKRVPVKIHLPPIRKIQRDKIQNVITVFNRLTLNKMLANNQTPVDDTSTWLGNKKYTRLAELSAVAGFKCLRNTSWHIFQRVPGKSLYIKCDIRIMYS